MSEPNANLFAPLNDYFDHIYVLTLKRSEQRQENVSTVLAGLNWSFFFGTDKGNLSFEQVQNDNIYDDELHRQTKRTHRSMNMGEIACSLSHKSIYQDMLDNGYKRVLIMEDDVLPQPESLSYFAQAVTELPEDWELLMLGYYDEKRPGAKSSVQQSLYRAFHKLGWFNWQNVSLDYINDLLMREYSAYWFEIGKVLGAHAYAVSASAAQKFIDYQSPVKLQADRIFNYYKAEQPLKAFAIKDTMFTLSELSKVSYIQKPKN